LDSYSSLALSHQSSGFASDVKRLLFRHEGSTAHVIPFVLIRITSYAIAAIVATLVLGSISSRLISFDSATTVLLFGVVIGVINAFIKPVVALLSLPITCLTFGLFALVINTVLFYFGAYLTPGMDVSWWGALFGSLLTSIASGLMFSVVDE
jgi:putative membrane protein